ncbi:hypothetical protein SDJN02_17801, partial [Cucurbita argyrosperma subsp. argyrosperma]
MSKTQIRQIDGRRKASGRRIGGKSEHYPLFKTPNSDRREFRLGSWEKLLGAMVEPLRKMLRGDWSSKSQAICLTRQPALEFLFMGQATGNTVEEEAKFVGEQGHYAAAGGSRRRHQACLDKEYE